MSAASLTMQGHDMKTPDEDLGVYEREYDRVGSELVANESMGDSRVNLHLGLWTAAMGGALVATTAPHPAEFTVLFAALLTALLLLGLVTLARIQKRNHHTDVLTDSLGRLRVVLVTPTARPLYFLTSPWSDDLVKKRRPALWHLGLLHVLYLANAMTTGQLARTLTDQWVACLIAASLCWALQVAAIAHSNGIAYKERVQRNAHFVAWMEPTKEPPPPVLAQPG